METMKKLFFFVLAILLSASAVAQNVTLKFTGRNNVGDYVRMDSVRIENTTRSWVETLTFPDTVLRLKFSGIESPSVENLAMKAYPNPFNGRTNLSMQLSNNDDVSLQVFNFAGQMVAEFSQNLEAGEYLFDLSLEAPQVYLAVLSTSHGRCTAKMINRANGGANGISVRSVSKASLKRSSNQVFGHGDMMSYTGYFTNNRRVVASGQIQQAQNAGENFTLIFTTVFVPTLRTNDISGRTDTSARCGGNVTSDGGAPVTERGICFSTSQNPTTSDNVVVASTAGTGSYTCPMGGLTPSTTYYVRAYAINQVGTAYGEEKCFTSLTLPVVTTNTVTNVASTSALCSGTVVSDGGANIISRGFCYGTSHNPSVSDNRAVASTNGTGAYTCNITTFSPRTTYYIRAYATNSVGTSYGAEMTFTTLALPDVESDSVFNITPVSARCAGRVLNDGGAPVTARGFCYGRTPMPVVATDSIVRASSNGTGSFACDITGLDTGVTYYVRAFATNSVGTNYGAQMTFTTQYLPVVLIDLINNITNSSATCRGIVRDDGGSPVTERGVCYDTAHNPTMANNVIVAGTNGTGAYISIVTGLEANTTYYVRPYARTSVGLSYGAEWSFTTKSLPTVNTSLITNLTDTSAVCGGMVRVDANTPTITGRGICYSTTPGPTVLDNVIPDATGGAGSFSFTIPNLTSGVTYYVRAYALHSIGTSYGEERSFRTLSTPVVTTNNITNVTNTTVNCKGIVQHDGGLPIIERGICFGLAPNPTVSGRKVVEGNTSLGSFTCDLTNLTHGTLYHVRAYATNAMGTSYGIDRTFTTRSLPTVTTDTVTNVTGVSSVCEGTVLADAGLNITSRGICYGTSHNPTTANNVVPANANGLGSYSCNLINLNNGTTYYYRAYATNSNGTAYGVERSFRTLSVPSVTTDNVTGVTGDAAVCGGNVVNDGGVPITSEGICYSTSQNPTIYDNIIPATTAGLGTFTCNLASLAQGTTYYVRAYAINSVGTAYGTQKTFTTLVFPSVRTDTIRNITGFTATCEGTVIASGGSSILSRGFCYSTTANPSIANNTVAASSNGVGTYSCNLTGLTGGTTYYVKAYVTTQAGTSYGAQKTFSTLYPPTVTTDTVTNITRYTATCSGSVRALGGGPIVESGICYSNTPDPTLSNSHVAAAANISTSFSCNLAGLAQGTTYYYRAYSTNTIGTSYGAVKTFLTLSMPRVSTDSVIGVTASTAICHGNVASAGGTVITNRGFCYSTSQNPSISNSTVVPATANSTGTYACSLTGLASGTTYYVRAYATNSVGTAYGVQMMFVTP